MHMAVSFKKTILVSSLTYYIAVSLLSTFGTLNIEPLHKQETPGIYNHYRELSVPFLMLSK